MPESVNALEQYYRDLGPATANPNFLAQGRRANVAQRSMPGPTMQAANTQLAKELSSMGDRGAIPDLINRGLIANTAGLPVDLVNTVLQSLGLGAEQPVGGSDSIRRALEYYGLSSETKRPMLETLAGLTPPKAVMGAARAAGQGAEAVSRAAAPVAGQAIENYLVRSGGVLPMVSTKEGRIPETASDVSKLADLLAKRADSAKIDYIHDKSKISPSEYFQFTKPDGEPVKLRISNHLEVYKGNDLSVDPQSKITFEEAIKSLQNSGIPIPNKAIADKSMQTKINKLYSSLDKKLPMKMMNQLWDIDSIKDQKQKYEALLKLNDSIVN